MTNATNYFVTLLWGRIQDIIPLDIPVIPSGQNPLPKTAGQNPPS